MESETLKLVAEQILSRKDAVDKWLKEHQQKIQPPFYCSMDLRDSGHKIVPVDSNLYPAGFNNICQQDIESASQLVHTHVESIAGSSVRKILILPESHTHNKFYLDNLYFLQQIIQSAGFEVGFGWHGALPNAGESSFSLESFSEKNLRFDAVSIENGVMSAGTFVPDMILLNNDFSSGYPRELDDVKQPVVPSHKLGWHSRKKSQHFLHYNRLAGELASLIDVDPWAFQVETKEVTPVDFSIGIGVEEVCKAVDAVLANTSHAYAKRNISRKPTVFIKHNAGTYGMGIMVATSSDEVRNMNRRTKNKMSVGKNNLAIDSVIVQEGVPTTVTSDGLVAEPVVYLFGWEIVGAFLRTNSERGDEDNLNSQGMVFKKLCLADLKKEPSRDLVHRIVANVSTLAAALELAELK